MGSGLSSRYARESLGLWCGDEPERENMSLCGLGGVEVGGGGTGGGAATSHFAIMRCVDPDRANG